MKTILTGLLLFSAIGFAQPHPMGFLSQDSLLQIYYAPKFRWADSIIHIIRRQATGHSSEEVYQQIKVLRQKNQAGNKPPVSYHSAHSTIFWQEKPAKRKKGIR